jgi:hypothetical protein
VNDGFPDHVVDWPFEDEGYSDSQRLDELNTAEDYNRFEEEQLAQERDYEDYLDEQADLEGDEDWLDQAMGA